MPWRHAAGAEIQLYSFRTSALDARPGRFYPQGKNHRYNIEYESERAPELVWMIWRGDNYLASARIWTPDSPAKTRYELRNVISMHTRHCMLEMLQIVLLTSVDGEKRSQPNLRHYARICTEELKKTTKNLIQDYKLYKKCTYKDRVYASIVIYYSSKNHWKACGWLCESRNMSPLWIHNKMGCVGLILVCTLLV
jgi:hypothetical protein